ncbi:MAG: DUF4418 family protein [Oscillospiraceae bacterium]|nr:DUF4418 family protein [Oscillospiraceae bacterium]
MEQKKKFAIGVTDVILAVVELLFFIGMLTFLRPCAAMEDGSWMTCHWAGQAVTGVAGALLVIALAHLFVDARAKIGMDIALAVVAVLAICIPGRLIHLCMMDMMRCRSVMTPGVIVLSVLTIAAAAADVLVQRKK